MALHSHSPPYPHRESLWRPHILENINLSFLATSTCDYFPSCFGCLAKHGAFHSFLRNHPRPCMPGLCSKAEGLPRPGPCPRPCRIPPLQTLGSGLYLESCVALLELTVGVQSSALTEKWPCSMQHSTTPSEMASPTMHHRTQLQPEPAPT